MRHRTAALVVPLLVLAALLSGCGDADRPATNRTDNNGAWFSSARDLMAAMKRAGVDCQRWTPVADPTNGAVELGSCYPDGRDSDLVVGIYSSSEDAAAAVKAVAGLGVGATFLIGRNWTLNLGSTPDLVEPLQRALGGQVIDTPAQSTP